jgi:hypothetical protein
MFKILENGVEFVGLSMNEYEAVERKLRASRDAFTKEKIERCGLKGMEAYAAWKDSGTANITANDVYGYVRETRDGAVAVLEKSLELGGVPAEDRKQIISTYNVVDAGNLAAALLGFERRVPFTIAVEAKETNPT